MPQHALPGGQQHVSRDEPSGGGIVVAALQVVESGLPVIDIPAVAERLEESERTCERAGGRHLLSPRIVRIFYHSIAACVNQLYNIALRIAEVVVFVIALLDRNDIAACVIP